MEKKLSQDLWWGEECEFCSKFQERFSQQALLTFTFLVCLQICTSLTSINFENQKVFLWQRSCCVFCFCLLTYKYKSVKIGDQLASFYKKTFDRGVSKSIFESVFFLDCIFQKCFWAQRLVREGLIEPKWSHLLFIVSLFVFKMINFIRLRQEQEYWLSFSLRWQHWIYPFGGNMNFSWDRGFYKVGSKLLHSETRWSPHWFQLCVTHPAPVTASHNYNSPKTLSLSFLCLVVVVSSKSCVLCGSRKAETSSQLYNENYIIYIYIYSYIK